MYNTSATGAIGMRWLSAMLQAPHAGAKQSSHDEYEHRPYLDQGDVVLHVNSQRLVEHLEALNELDGRFTNIRLINMPGGEKRGHFSLIFKAHDKIEDKPVALKFLDQDPTKIDAFRLSCFDREHELLQTLIGAARCMQVISPISFIEFDIGPQGSPFYLRAKYFVTEWYDADIDAYFLRQDPLRALSKLRLFNEVVLAIEALHHRNIFHRDVKVDNFRRADSKSIDGVVAIDLGTAALDTSTPMLKAYAFPVGALTYSAPESFCGLAADRGIAFSTDTYALGCMLFELFAEDDFGTAYLATNPDFESRLSALRYLLAPFVAKPDLLPTEWGKHAPKLLNGLTALSFTKDGSSVPLGILDTINDLVRSMTVPDFNYRTITLEQVRRRLWSAIRCLENERIARIKAERAARLRTQRRERAKIKGQKAIAGTPLEHRNGRA